MYDNPNTPQQWQAAVNLASAGLIIAGAKERYGMILPAANDINVARCSELLNLGAERGVYPVETAVHGHIAGARG